MTDPEPTPVATIEDLLEDVGDLPTLPVVVTKINSMTSNPQTNASDIGRVISNDPSLSSKILRLVNSAYYGFPRKINSVTTAIVLLGFNKVKNMALSASIVDTFKDGPEVEGFDFYKFWEHSVAAAIAAEAVARLRFPALSDDAFVCGLFHDLGKAAMVGHVPGTNQAFIYARENGVTFFHASTATLPADNAKTGSLLAEHWNFPEPLVRSIRYWPVPERARQSRELVICTHVANVVTSALGMTAPGDYALPILSEEVYDELSLTEEVLGQIARETLDGFDHASAFLELAN